MSYALLESPRIETAPGGEGNWYAVCVRHQNETRVEAALRFQGWETLVPRYRSRRVWSDRIKELDIALFGGFVFCRFAPRERRKIEDTPGVLRIVSFGGMPAPVEPEEIAAIRRVAESRLPLSPWPYLKEGDRVRVERGPLRGVEGRLLRARDSVRLIVGVELLQRAIACELDPDMVVPLRTRAAGR